MRSSITSRISELPRRLTALLSAGLLLALGLVLAETAAQQHSRHRLDEQVAHDWAYNIDKDPTTIDRMHGQDMDLVESINGEFGFSAIVVKDRATGEVTIGFRGTDDIKDGVDDLGEIGSIQYDRNRETIERLAQQYPDSKVTGHSLGGALAQKYTADHPERVREQVLFQSPGITQEEVDKYRQSTGGPGQPPLVPSYLYVADGDPVSELGGEAYIDSHVTIASGGNINSAEKGSGWLSEHTGLILQGDDRVEYVETDSETYDRNRIASNVDGLGYMTAVLIRTKQTGEKALPWWLRPVYNVALGPGYVIGKLATNTDWEEVAGTTRRPLDFAAADPVDPSGSSADGSSGGSRGPGGAVAYRSPSSQNGSSGGSTFKPGKIEKTRSWSAGRER